MLCSMWNLPGPGIELASPTLADGFFITATKEALSEVFSMLIVLVESSLRSKEIFVYNLCKYINHSK